MREELHGELTVAYERAAEVDLAHRVDARVQASQLCQVVAYHEQQRFCEVLLLEFGKMLLAARERLVESRARAFAERRGDEVVAEAEQVVRAAVDVLDEHVHGLVVASLGHFEYLVEAVGVRQQRAEAFNQ